MVAFGSMEEEGRLGLEACNRNTDWSGCLLNNGLWSSGLLEKYGPGLIVSLRIR